MVSYIPFSCLVKVGCLSDYRISLLIPFSLFLTVSIFFEPHPSASQELAYKSSMLQIQQLSGEKKSNMLASWPVLMYIAADKRENTDQGLHGCISPSHTFPWAGFIFPNILAIQLACTGRGAASTETHHCKHWPFLSKSAYGKSCASWQLCSL